MPTPYRAFHIGVTDELLNFGSAGGQDIEDRIVVYVWDSSDQTLAALYTDPNGSVSLNNPFTLGSSGNVDQGVAFFSDAARVDLLVVDFGEDLSASTWLATTTKHSERLGRDAFLPNVRYNDPHSHIVLPRHSSNRMLVIPFRATGTDANDTPATWDNAEASCVIAPGETQQVYLSTHFVIKDVITNVRTVDAAATFELGLDSAETGGDADGFVDAASIATAGQVYHGGLVTVGGTETYYSSATLGAYLRQGFIVGTNVDQDYGLFQRREYHCRNNAARTVSITGSAAIDTAVGEIYIMGYMVPFFNDIERANNVGV